MTFSQYNANVKVYYNKTKIGINIKMPRNYEIEPTLIPIEVDSSDPEAERDLKLTKIELGKVAIDMLIGDKLETPDEKIEKRIAELSTKLGEKYTDQRPEIQLAIAKLPEIGIKLQKAENGEISDGQEITPENIAFVRTTDYLPIDKDGAKTVLTAFEATRNDKEPVFRLTSHWTVNHVVHDHTMGEFEGRKVTIIAPAGEMLQENGTPESMLPVDTFWNNNIRLPKNSVVITYERTEETEGVIQLEKEDDSETITMLALRAMGYSTVKDHPTYTETGFDIGVYDLGESMGIEESRLHIDMVTKETAIENYFHPGLGGEHVSTALERMVGEYWVELPNEVQKATVDSLVELAAMKIPEAKKHTIYDGLEKILIDFLEKYSIETRKAFSLTLPYEVIDDFVKSESAYQEQQGEATKKEMVDFYLDQFADILEASTIEKLRSDNQ